MTVTRTEQLPESETGGRRKRILAVLGVVAIAIALAVWLSGRNVETTDDAFVQADIVQIAAKVPGTVKAVAVKDNQAVKAGDLLLELDAADYEVKLEQAKADLAAAEADLELTDERGGAGVSQAGAGLRSFVAEAERAEADAARLQQLYDKDEISRQQLEAAQASARSLRARADEARSRLTDARSAPRQVRVKQAVVAARAAALRQAELNLSYTRLLAPRDGIVTRKNVLPGAQIAAGAPLLAIVSSAPWVVANFKETQLARLKIGQPVKIRIDAYPDADFTGHVESVQSGTGSVFSLLPPENATGNFVKVVQRVPVKIAFDPAPAAEYRLVPGMSAEPKVDVSAEPAAAPN